jgi:aminopeptidase N
MKWPHKILFFILFLFSAGISGQDIKTETCSGIDKFHINNLKDNISDSRLSLYDVTFYYIDLEVNNINTSIAGFTEIHGSALNVDMPELVFELSDTLIIDSLFLNGTLWTGFIHTDNLITIYPDPMIGKGEHFIARIYYHGDPGSNGFFSGISSRTDYYWNQRVTYTLSEPFHARDWFVCKQVLTDKADSAYINITTDTSLMAGSNGLLDRITPVPGGRHRFEWKTKYPVAFYLLSITVADYQDYSIYAHPVMDGDSVLIQNYIFDIPAFLDSNRKDIDATADMIELYSNLFSVYPFQKEKYGHCYAPMGGGMEHQTMTTLSSFHFSLVAHELGHQWFGDNVTCATWQDIWINEGFASYTEYLALENLVSVEDANLWMASAHEIARTQPDGSIYIPEEDINDEYRIFSVPLSYKKGAAILHMIRYELNNDELFFNTLRTFQQVFKDSTATGLDFMEILETTSGQDFNWFFDQWYFGKGYPVFSMTWWQENDSLYIISSQTGSSTETPFFKTHIDFRLRYEDNTDTLIRMEQTENYNIFHIPSLKLVSDVLADPDNWILDVITITKKPLQEDAFIIGPNPFTDDIMVQFHNSNIHRDIIISDLGGRIVGRFETEASVINLPVKNLVRGVYLFTVLEEGKLYTSKIVKV